MSTQRNHTAASGQRQRCAAMKRAADLVSGQVLQHQQLTHIIVNIRVQCHPVKITKTDFDST